MGRRLFQVAGRIAVVLLTFAGCSESLGSATGAGGEGGGGSGGVGSGGGGVGGSTDGGPCGICSAPNADIAGCPADVAAGASCAAPGGCCAGVDQWQCVCGNDTCVWQSFCGATGGTTGIGGQGGLR